jgi:hypothetical protein
MIQSELNFTAPKPINILQMTENIAMKYRILEILQSTKKRLASHEFFQYGIISNDHTISARLNYWERMSEVDDKKAVVYPYVNSQYRTGKRFKEWFIEVGR